MESTPIYQFSAPKGACLEPPPSSQPINTEGYDIRLGFIALVRELSFEGREDENPYTHLREFLQLCTFIAIPGMSHDTVKWKLFPFSLTGKARKWYDRTVGSVEGN